MPPQEATDRPNKPAADGAAGEPSVTLAVVIGAHGINGQVRLKVFAEDFGSHKSFNGGKLTVKSAQSGNNGMIVRFAEVADRNTAEAMRGTELTVPRSALPPLGDGEYYHADLMGLAVMSTNGDDLGRVVLIENFGAGDVLEIERPDGKRFMVPMNADAVPEWNAERLVVTADFVE